MNSCNVDKRRDIASALDRAVSPGARVMVGGFGRGGTPFTLLEYLADRPETFHHLTVLKNDANEPTLGLGPLFAKGMVDALISTHIGLNPDLIRRMNLGELQVELIPQGIFAERIRAGGAGIPAFLSDVGIDTPVAEGRARVSLNGRDYLLEEALRGDTALLCADRADTMGNCWWRGSNRNMSVVMGTACDTVVVEAFDIVNPGDIAPEDVHLPGVFVTSVVQAGPRRHQQIESETRR